MLRLYGDSLLYMLHFTRIKYKLCLSFGTADNSNNRICIAPSSPKIQMDGRRDAVVVLMNTSKLAVVTSAHQNVFASHEQRVSIVGSTCLV